MEIVTKFLQRNAQETRGEPHCMKLLDSVRRPEYTGSNRCWPCTVLNAVVLAVLTFVAALLNPLLGVIVLVAGVAGIVYRGYVIPHTPTFAPRLVAAIPGAQQLFTDHQIDPPTDRQSERNAGGIGGENADGEAVLTTLIESDILTGDADLHIAEDVADDWWDEMRAIADDSLEELATAVDAESPTPVRTKTYERDGRAWIIVTDEAESLESETWLSRPVAIADIAIVRTLANRGVDRRTAADAASPLRLFLEECPDCGGEVVETTGDGCCGGFGPGGPTHVLACRKCGQRLATIE